MSCKLRIRQDLTAGHVQRGRRHNTHSLLRYLRSYLPPGYGLQQHGAPIRQLSHTGGWKSWQAYTGDDTRSASWKEGNERSFADVWSFLLFEHSSS